MPGRHILFVLFLSMPVAGLCAQGIAPDYIIIPAESHHPQSSNFSQTAPTAIVGDGYLLTVGENPAFTLEFEDVRDRTGRGFDDPLLGSDRQDVAASVFEHLSKVLGGEPGSARIRISSDSPWLNDDSLAIGIPLFQCTDGFQKPIIHNAIHNDVRVHSHEGELLVNFDLPLNSSTDTPQAGEYDLYTSLFHEMVHILGFVGFTVEPDGRPRDCGGARMIPAIARYTTDDQGNPLWVEQDGEIRFAGTIDQLPSQSHPLSVELPSSPAQSLHLDTGQLRITGHWLKQDFLERDGVLMLVDRLPTATTRRNLTPETKIILQEILEYQVAKDARGLSGAWVDAALNGQGFTLHFLGKNRFVIYFYGSTDAGERLWMLGLHDGPFNFGDPVTMPLIEVSGGQFNHINPVNITETPWGELEINFQDCSNAVATLSGIDGTQMMQLFALARIDGLDCF